MKKLIALALVMLVTLGAFAGCKPAQTNPDATEPSAGTETPSGGLATEALPTDPPEAEPVYGGTFVYPISKDPNTLLYAWITSGTTNRISSFLNDKLYIIDAQGNITYRICDDMKLSDDGLVYTFHVRDNAMWHDGTPVLASDICWTRNIMYDPNWFMALQFEMPGTWEAVDEKTFTVTLEKPDPNFLYVVMDLMFPQPEHYWADEDVASYFSCPKSTQPIGCGPFKFVEYKVGDYIKLEAFEDFWGGRPYLDQVYFKVIGDASEIQIAFETSQVSAYITTEDYYEEIKDNPGFKFLIGPSSQVAMIEMGCAKYQWVDAESRVDTENELYVGQRAFREALAYMVPYDDMINKVLRGACVRSYTNMPNDGQYYTEEGITKYSYDLDKANQILDEAGWVDTDGDGIRNWSDGTNMVMAFSYYDAGGVNERMCVLMSEQLNKCGIACGLTTEETTSWTESLLGTSEYDASELKNVIYAYYYGGRGALAYDYATQFTTSGGQSPYISYGTGEVLPDDVLQQMYEPEVLASQARLDELFAQMNNTQDTAEAAECFAEIQRILTNDMIWQIPIGTMQKRIAFQGNIRGVEDAIWFTNNNYLGFAMEKIWIDPAA